MQICDLQKGKRVCMGPGGGGVMQICNLQKGEGVCMGPGGGLITLKLIGSPQLQRTNFFLRFFFFLQEDM